MNSDVINTRGRPGMTFVVVFVSLVLTIGLAARILSDFDWDPTAFVGFGEEATKTRQYAEDLLGDVVLRQASGHDGKFFFVQATDPWLAKSQDRRELLDYPVHRSRRMLYPLLAGGLGFFGGEVVVWSLLASNVLWMALGTWGTARLARILGGSAWWGLAFVLNIGLLFALIIDGAGILALALAIWAVAFFHEGRLSPAVALLAASALTREVMVLCALGIGIWCSTNQRRRQAILVLVVPSLVLVVWEVYIRVRLGPDPALPGSFGVPFVGLLRAARVWTESPIVVLLGICLVFLIVLYLRRWWIQRSLLEWAFLGFVPVAILFTAAVWTELFDFTRALAPILTASILVVFVENGPDSDDRGQNPIVGFRESNRTIRTKDSSGF